MNQPMLQKIPRCGRCDGSGWHTHGICFGCKGLGVAPASDYGPYKRNVDALVGELGKAEIIIHAMLNAMTLEQKTTVAAQLEASGVSPDGMTRANERRAVLEVFGA
jgi:hypothetical protein